MYVEMLHLSCSDVTSLICFCDVTSVICVFRCYICPIYVQMLHLSYVFCDVTSLMFRCYICPMYVQMLHLSYNIFCGVTSLIFRCYICPMYVQMLHLSCSDVTSVLCIWESVNSGLDYWTTGLTH